MRESPNVNARGLTPSNEIQGLKPGIRKVLILACLAHPVNALEQISDIQIRIHAPFPDLYPQEADVWLVRVENRGREAIPVPDGSSGLTDELPPRQFHVQTRADSDAGRHPQASSWEEIWRFSDGSMELINKSVLEGGQAMEGFSWGLPGQLATPQEGGMFRVAMQVGSDEFVYSNWITRTRRAEPVTEMSILHAGDPKGSGSEYHIALSEETKPPYLWYFSNRPADRFLRPWIYRICEVPEGMVPEVEPLDRDYGQYVVSFPRGGPDAVYFAHRCGLAKTSPWPRSYRGRDYLLTSYPVSTPSPIGFPMDLFQEDMKEMPNHPGSDDRPRKSRAVDAASVVEGTGGLNGIAVWCLGIALMFLAGFISFLVRMKRMTRK